MTVFVIFESFQRGSQFFLRKSCIMRGLNYIILKRLHENLSCSVFKNSENVLFGGLKAQDCKFGNLKNEQNIKIYLIPTVRHLVNFTAFFTKFCRHVAK